MAVTMLSSCGHTDGHFVNSSQIPFPGPVRHYTLNNTDVRMIYEQGDCGCFCKIENHGWTVCVGKECLNVPLKVKIYHQRLRIKGTEIRVLTPADFIDYTNLVELQVFFINQG